MSTLVIGADPGQTTGLFVVLYTATGKRLGDPVAAQIHGSEGVVPFVSTLLQRGSCDDREPLIAVEQFVVGARAARSSSAHAGRITRALITELSELADAEGATLFLRAAAMVKPWATDRRLDAAGLLAATEGMHHARDAARHALYAAVKTGVAADPLSLRAVR